MIDFGQKFRESLDGIVDLLKIASVYDENTINEKMPYGENVYKAFDYMIQKGREACFEIEEYDGHAVSFTYGDSGNRIDIACHLDVVAADDEDFSIRIEDGKLIGRGTSDMKVPAYLHFLCLKMLKERYPHPKNTIRLVLGGDEERTMNDMRYYLEHAGAPSFAYTPDGMFPIGIGEKGALMWTLHHDYEWIIESFSGGIQCNIVSPYGEAVLKDDTRLDEIRECIRRHSINAEAHMEDGRTVICVTGEACHASRPDLGRNATIDLLQVISEVYDDGISGNLYAAYGDRYGRGFDSFVSEDHVECLSVNLGVLKIEDGRLTAQVDCRYPFSEDSAVLTERLQKVSIPQVSLDYDDPPTLCSENDPYVRCMLETYRETTGDSSRPIISGGVSYSKVFRHCVSYGPNMDGRPQVAHQKGEYVLLSDCVRWFEIYYRTMEKLMFLEVDENE